MSNKRILAAVVLTVGMFVCTAHAAVSWDVVASGSNARFGWMNGQNNTDRFGDPTVDVTGFLFDNTDNFKATTTNTSVADFARVTVDSNLALSGPADLFNTITVQEWGTFDGNVEDVSVQADFALIRYAPVPGFTTSLSLLNDATIFDVQNKTWYTERTLDLTELATWNVEFNRFQITVTDTVQVNGAAAAGTFIEKDGMRIIVPEPGTCALLVIGMIPFFRRRR